MRGGFTLIELIVVIAIFGIITSIALFNQGKLNSNILVSNLAYEIALSVREAQSYGVGVRAANTSNGFEGGYGISFDASRPDDIILFNDKNDDKLFTADEEASRLTIQNQRGNKVTATCISATMGAVTTCVHGSYSIDHLDIIFKRPNPEALFVKGTLPADVGAAGPAYIVVNTPSGDNCRVIIVELTGQVRVENSSGGHCQ